jgi:hypothetical protein
VITIVPAPSTDTTDTSEPATDTSLPSTDTDTENTQQSTDETENLDNENDTATDDTNQINETTTPANTDNTITVPIPANGGIDTINNGVPFVSSTQPQYARVCQMLTYSPYLSIFIDRGICRLFIPQNFALLSLEDIQLASSDAG